MNNNFEIRKFGDPALKEKAAEVDHVDRDLKKLIEAMKKILGETDGVGLAAPQIGVLKRVIVLELDDKKSVFLNPRILWKSDEVAEDEEGCLSIPGIKVKVPRSAAVKIEADSLGGKSSVVETEGILSRIFQHEIDHLDGLLILDRTSRSEKKRALQELGLLPTPLSK